VKDIKVAEMVLSQIDRCTEIILKMKEYLNTCHSIQVVDASDPASLSGPKYGPISRLELGLLMFEAGPNFSNYTILTAAISLIMKSIRGKLLPGESLHDYIEDLAKILGLSRDGKLIEKHIPQLCDGVRLPDNLSVLSKEIIEIMTASDNIFKAIDVFQLENVWNIHFPLNGFDITEVSCFFSSFIFISH
jgi:hypothetical protein